MDSGASRKKSRRTTRPPGPVHCVQNLKWKTCCGICFCGPVGPDAGEVILEQGAAPQRRPANSRFEQAEVSRLEALVRLLSQPAVHRLDGHVTVAPVAVLEPILDTVHLVLTSFNCLQVYHYFLQKERGKLGNIANYDKMFLCITSIV